MPYFGVLNVNKPVGPTSRDAVNRVERLCRPAKAGHAGTLDPLASGVLVICVGQATRLISYVQRMRKSYRAMFLLGHQSETDDTEGNVAILANAHVPTRDELDRALPQFIGTIEQRPPAHSAIKVAGRRAYALARRGVVLELPPRAVEIFRLHVVRYEHPVLELEIECGSGTYVRAVGRDLAAALNTTSVMSALERTAIGDFRVADAAALDELTAETFYHHLQPPLTAVAELPRIVLDDPQIVEIRHGRLIPMPNQSAANSERGEAREWAALDVAGQLVAIIHEKHSGQFGAQMNFA